MSLADRTLRALLDDVAAATPAPGGGSSCAVACALAGALVEMAAGFAGDDAARGRAGQLRAEALALADEDLVAFAPVIEARRGGGDVAAALARAAQPPQAVARIAGELAQLGERLERDGRPALAGDAHAGTLLARAARDAAADLARLNLAESRLSS